MKLPGIFDTIMQKKKEHKEVYISLYLDEHAVGASFWSLSNNGAIQILASDGIDGIEDAWEKRSEAVDTILGTLEDKTGITDVTKVVLGLPQNFLSSNGNIKKEVGAELKEFTNLLELKAIGFVPIHQAIVYDLQKTEGVPPSIILLNVCDTTLTLSIYKIGVLIGNRELQMTDSVAHDVESGLKSYTDVEVLPARIVLYGSDTGKIENVKSELLRHQWTSHVNFLHFPKIDSLSGENIVVAVAAAGASEMTDGVGTKDTESQSVEASKEPDNDLKQEGDQQAHQTEDESREGIVDADNTELPEHEQDEEIESQIHTSPPSEAEDDEMLQAQDIIDEDYSTDSHAQDANIVMVEAESLGFKKHTDILEEDYQIKKPAEETRDAEQEDETEEKPISGKTFSFKDIIPNGKRLFVGLTQKLSSGPHALIIGGVLIIGILSIAALYYFVPHAIVTVMQEPKILESSQNIIIDPGATVVDAEKKIIPGKKREKTISGDKTVPATGTKNIGDPAKGTVTLFNKSLSTRVLRKGTILTSGTLKFTLDAETQIASASENIDNGTITYGRIDAPVTASAIGAQSNIQSGSDFTVADVSSSVAVARNEKALSGGTSKQVTVVSRDDYASFITIITQELTTKAKEDVSTLLEKNESLIDETIKTTVTEKVFSQEIDQETSQLQGKVTIKISGIAYAQDDIRALMMTMIRDSIPQGYTVRDTQTSVVLSNIVVKKDGTITAKASVSATAFPDLKSDEMQKQLAGKSTKQAQEYLRSIQGVAGIEVRFRFNPLPGKMPVNYKNISVSIVGSQ